VKQNLHTNQALYHTRQHCINNYGFSAHPNLTLQQNFNLTLQKESNHIKGQPFPFNSTFHNLCTLNKTPPSTRQLLGLNLKFCLASNKIQNNIPTTLRKMAYNIRTAHYLKENNIADNMEYNKQIYLKNKHWDPPPAPSNIENKIMEFEKALTTAHLTQVTKTSKLTLNNQTIPQQQTLKLLKSNNNSTIKPTDKNLGPAGMGIYTYISMVLKEHLLTKDYSQILPLEAKRRMENLKQNLISLLQTHQAILTKQEKLYFNRSLETQHRLPVFYGLPKVHKNPVSLRPIISTCGSLLSIFSIWLDFKMKELLQLVKSYLKTQQRLLMILKT